MAVNRKEYNINAIRPALIEARENGNRQTVSKAMCERLNISEFYFNMYQHFMQQLFDKVAQYCKVKNSPTASSDEKQEAFNVIFPLWKEMLSFSEKDETSRDLRASEHDISNLVGFCQVLMNDANNVDFKEDFVAKKAFAVSTFKQFVKKVEMDLGIRIAGIECMTDMQRDFLRKQSKLCRGIEKSTRRLNDLTAQSEILNRKRSKAKSAEAKTIYDEEIQSLDDQINDMNEKIASLMEKLKNLEEPSDIKVAENQENNNTPKTTNRKSRKKSAPEQNDGKENAA